MAIITIDRPDVSTDIQGAVKFSVDASAAPKLAQMLGNYLYSDKEYAVISELCANAYDIHRVTGKGDTPIKVNLPTPLDPTFVVRDYGTGMSEEDVYKFLTSYGASSKTDTNEQIGFWGLGSKSPSAVTDSWSIISYHNGVKTHYEVFIDSDGVPSLKKVFSGANDETGLEVRVPVKNTSFYLWERAAARAFTHYDVRPKLNKHLHIPSPGYSVKFDRWALTNTSNLRIVTTMREYDLDKTKITNFIANDDPIRYLLEGNGYGSLGVTMFFGIGEIDLSISREQVQYNQKTVNSIIKCLRDVYDSIVNDYKTQLAARTDINYLTYRTFVSNFLQKYNFRGLVQQIVADDGNKFGVVNIPHDIMLFSTPVKREQTFDLVCVSPGRNKAARITKSFSTWKTRKILLNSRYTGNDETFTIDIPVDFTEKVEVVIDDCRGAMARIKYSGDHNKMYILVKDNFFPYLKVSKASSFAQAPRQPRGGSKVPREYYILQDKKFRRIKDEKVFTSFNGTVSIVGGKIKFENKDTHAVCVKIQNSVQATRDNVPDDAHIRFLRNTFKCEIVGYVNNKPAGMRTPYEEIKHLYTKLMNSKDVKQNLDEYKLSRALHAIWKRNDILLRNIIMFGGKIKSHQFADVISPLMELMKYYEKKQSFGEIYVSFEGARFLRCAEYLNKPFTIGDVQVNMDGVFKACNLIYPMLQFVNGDWGEGNGARFTQIQKYIDLVDSQQGV